MIYAITLRIVMGWSRPVLPMGSELVVNGGEDLAPVIRETLPRDERVETDNIILEPLRMPLVGLRCQDSCVL